MFTYEENTIQPLRTTGQCHCLHHINLLLLTCEGKWHYCLITNLNRFKSRNNRHTAQLFYCSYCLRGFSKNTLLLEHQQHCSQHEARISKCANSVIKRCAKTIDTLNPLSFIREILSTIEPMNFTEKHDNLIMIATHCCLCKKSSLLMIGFTARLSDITIIWQERSLDRPVTVVISIVNKLPSFPWYFTTWKTLMLTFYVNIWVNSKITDLTASLKILKGTSVSLSAHCDSLTVSSFCQLL